MQILGLGTATAGLVMTGYNGIASFLMRDTHKRQQADVEQTRRILETVYRDAWVWTPGFMKALTIASGHKPILAGERQFGVPVMEVTVAGIASHQAPVVAQLPSYEQDREVAEILRSRPADTRGSVAFGIGKDGGMRIVFPPQAAELITQATHFFTTDHGRETTIYSGNDFADLLKGNLVLENHADWLDIQMKTGTKIVYRFEQKQDAPVEI